MVSDLEDKLHAKIMGLIQLKRKGDSGKDEWMDAFRTLTT